MWGVKMQVFNTAKELADISKYITKVQINISNIRRKQLTNVRKSRYIRQYTSEKWVSARAGV
mgnify:CR=1 FL=1